MDFHSVGFFLSSLFSFPLWCTMHVIQVQTLCTSYTSSPSPTAANKAVFYAISNSIMECCVKNCVLRKKHNSKYSLVQ